MRRLILIASLVLLSLVSAQAQSWPQRNVTWILPLGGGSGVDTTSRLLADRLATKWGRAVVIETARAATLLSRSMLS